MKTRKFTAIYYRVSKKFKNDIRMQKKICRDFCLSKNINNFKEYEERSNDLINGNMFDLYISSLVNTHKQDHVWNGNIVCQLNRTCCSRRYGDVAVAGAIGSVVFKGTTNRVG